MKIWKKSLLSFFAIFIAFSSIYPNIAQAQWYAPSFEDFNTKVNGDTPDSEIFGERYTQAQVYWIVHSLVVLLSGKEIQECIAKANGDVLGFANCMTTADAGGGASLAERSMGSPILMLAAAVDSSFSTPPASGIEYIASKIDRVNPATTTYAQEGIGYTSLQPVQGLWSAARNATYALSIIALVVLAFMIMFRRKVSPQMSVTIQTAIPKLVIGLVLITFSYAIAGLIIDLSYLLVGLLSGIIHASGVLDGGITSAGPIDTFNALNGVVHGVFSLMLLLFINLFLIGMVGLFIGGALVGVTGGAAAFAVGSAGVLAVVLGVIILIVALYALIRLFWVLFKSYMMVLILIITSPFFMLGSIFYSEALNFSRWLKLMVGSLSIFVVTSLLVFFAHYLTWSTTPRLSPIQDMAMFNPFGIETQTFSGATQLPGFQGIGVEFVGYFAGLFIILTIPALASNISKMLMGGRADQKASLLGAIPGAAGAVAMGGKATSGVMGTAFRESAVGKSYSSGGRIQQKISNVIDRTASMATQRPSNKPPRP